MAKKTPVKKSRRRLKRSVRRSLAAVLMITAIGVAAIPVPENYAADPDIMLFAENSTDVHLEALNAFQEKTAKLGLDDDKLERGIANGDEKAPSGITLNTYDPYSDANKGQGTGGTNKYEDAKDFVKRDTAGKITGFISGVSASYAVTETGTNSSGRTNYSLGWQYLYYVDTNPRGGGDGGVVCKYNSTFHTDKVELPLKPYTEYFAIDPDDIDNYFNEEDLVTTTPKLEMDDYTPKTPVKYTYKQWKGGAVKPDSFLTDYFEDEYNTWAAKCQEYYDKEKAGTLGDGDVEPDDFARTPSKDLTEIDDRVKYFTEKCQTLRNAGSGFKLYLVDDERLGHEGGTVYLAKDGTLSEQSRYFIGDYGFLATKQSDVSMCAIGNRAFAGVTNVENLTISDQIGYIGDEAFMGASLLQSIKLLNVTEIGNRAFMKCVELKTADLGTVTEKVGRECFSGDRQLQSISFGTSIKTIGIGAFYDCRNMTTVSIAGDGQACEVKDLAFYNCVGLTSVSMENANIISLGEGAFATASGSTDMSFVLPQSMSDSESIGDFLFSGRSSMKYVVFPQDYGSTYSSTGTEIPDNVFHGCVSLEYVEFPVVNNRWACGFVKYGKKLFADVMNEDFYVKGPKENSRTEYAYPRTSTWGAVTKVSKTVPYLYIDNGVEYYEVSDGYYLLCINDQGILTSCTLLDERYLDAEMDPIWSGELIIPSMVGNTKVVGIASGCFSDSDLNEACTSLVISDDSISSIADGVFQGGGGDNNADWLKLKEVYIGNSVASIGNYAFKGCTSLVDVTFATPSGGYEAFTIGTDAFKTGAPKLTFHGDIVEGYAPFEWAMTPDNIIDPDPDRSSLRVCYISPTYLTVMYNPITDMVTLLDYPKYDEISSILNSAHADEIKGDDFNYGTYENMRAQKEYAKYGIDNPDANQRRVTFAQQWQKLLSEGSDPTQLYSETLYYGPWVNEDFCKEWNKWIDGVPERASNDQNGNPLTDWLFEPIIAYAAAETPTNVPVPYYTTYPFDIAQIVGANDPYRLPTVEERKLVDATRYVEIPAGVESIDVDGYRRNLREDGTETNSSENDENYLTYLFYTWDNKSYDMYTRAVGPDEDGIKSVPGLFSGYYEDGSAAPSETRKRGNDLIQTVTMYTVKYLPDYAFDSCENLRHVQLGSELADIGKAPFRGCYSLQTVTDNDYYTTVDGIVYSYNSDGTLTIEECLAGRGAGGDMPGYPYINAENDPIIKNVSAIREGAFEDCNYITGVDFGRDATAGLTTIPEDCFKNCDSLGTVVLPATVNSVKSGAFVGANKLGYLTVWGREVDIDDNAFDTAKLEHKQWTTVQAYADSAVVRYVDRLGDKYGLRYDKEHPMDEWWSVSFYDANYELIEDLKDKDDEPLENPQYVKNGEKATEPQELPNTDDWIFERWVGMNNLKLRDPIYENAAFYAQGHSTSGMVNGKYPVTFWDTIDGKQVGPTQEILPGESAIPPAHPVHTGYDPNGYSADYTNVQSPLTILMYYKVTGTTSGGGTNTPGTTSGNGTNTPGTTSGKTTSSTSNSSSSTSSSSTSTSSSTSGSDGAVGKYTVTVENGSGSGTYDVGATVIIAANTPAAGMVFQKWTTESNGVALASVSMTATTFVMPANNVTVTANYVVGGTGGTSNINGTGSTGNTGNNGNNGNTRVDITKPGISNKDLATANVNGSTDNFIVRISETDEATRAVAEALTNKYGSLENILYYAMDISLYDSTGTVKITDTTGLSVDITIPIPDALVAYGGNNMAGAVVNGNQLENLNENFTTINGVPCIRFTATHFSPYTVYVDTGNLTEGMLDITPKTGDPIHPKWFLSIGLACLSVILFMKKDKAVKVKAA